MATKSILKTIVIKERHAANSFANALEKAKMNNPKPVEMSKPVKHLHKDQLLEIFSQHVNRH